MDRERPHADEVLFDALGISLVEAEDDLRVTARLEVHALVLQLLAQRGRVVDLAVVDDRDLLIVREHRLLAVLHIDDR